MDDASADKTTLTAMQYIVAINYVTYWEGGVRVVRMAVGVIVPPDK